MKPMEPWKPAKSGDIEHSKLLPPLTLSLKAHLMDMASKKRKRDDEDEDEDEDHEKRH